MRRFRLHRIRDESGISGTGTVAEGVAFTDGTVALRWLTATASTAVYASMADVAIIHGHGGATRIVYVDNDRAPTQIQETAGGTNGSARLAQAERVVEAARAWRTLHGSKHEPCRPERCGQLTCALTRAVDALDGAAGEEEANRG